MAGLEAPWELTGEGKERRGRGGGLEGAAGGGGRPWKGGLRGEAPWGCSLCFVAAVSCLLLFVRKQEEGEKKEGKREEKEKEGKEKKRKYGKFSNLNFFKKIKDNL
jgi:hypothetical protein